MTEKYAEKNKKKKAKGKQTTSRDLPPGKARNVGKTIEKRRKMLQDI